MFSSENNSSYNNPLFYNPQVPNNFTTFIPNNYIFPPTFSQIQDKLSFNSSSEHSITQENALKNSQKMIINQVSNSSKRATGRKDRHTKICTAQGVRDRRVRLSMSIAREFFNLQDLLGFDKASKTLEWLLAKAKTNIDELASSIDNKNLDKEEIEEEKGDNNKSTLLGHNKRKRGFKGVIKNGFDEVKRREEARERARERTRKKKFVSDYSLQRIDQSSSSYGVMIDSSCTNGVISEMEFVESKDDYLMDSRESSYNYNNYEMINLKDNDQESCNGYSEFLNKSISDSCNFGDFPAALNIINLSTGLIIVFFNQFV